MKIGLVDSGIGGLTTLSTLMGNVRATYYYYMDNVNMPYGDKTHEELVYILKNILRYFERLHVDIIVIACNTLSSIVDEDIKTQCSIHIVTIEPSIDEASRVEGRTLVIATPRTMMSKRFRDLMNGKHNIIAKSSKYLAKYIEDNDLKMAKYELSSLLAGEKAKNVVLGCTHYVHMKSYLEGRGYRVFEGNEVVLKNVENITKNSGIKEEKCSQIYIHSSKTIDVNRIAKHLKRTIILY